MKTFTFLMILLFPGFVFGQQNDSKDTKAILVNFDYGYQLPAGDMKNLYGNNFKMGLGIDYLSGNNWIFGLKWEYLFGDDVKNDVISMLKNDDGYIYGVNYAVAGIQLKERGFYAGAHIGKLFGLSVMNNRSGIRVTLGMGLLQHKIKIQDDPDVVVPLLSDKYKKGYDHLTNGLSINEFIGYQYLSKDKRINFIAGFGFYQAFTKNRRDWNFDTNSKDDTDRFDALVGFQLGITLPFYLIGKEEEIFY